MVDLPLICDSDVFFLVVVVSFVFFSNTFLLCIFVPGGCLFIYFDGCHLVEAIFNRYG